MFDAQSPQQTAEANIFEIGTAPDGADLDYLERVYWWAYLRPASLRIFDHPAVVSAILWGQYRELCATAIAEIAPGERVLQMACVYGDLSPRLARHLGPRGRLEIVDAAPIQAANAKAKLSEQPWATVRCADAAATGPERHDVVLCFFLLHELPDAHKRRVVDAALGQLRPGGRAIFLDYGRPARWHPLRPVMAAVFHLLEPFAAALWKTEIRSLASGAEEYHWSRTMIFAGLYQKVVATRRIPLASGLT